MLILSEDARKVVLDKLFGAEEEFEYASTTTPESDGEKVAAPPERAHPNHVLEGAPRGALLISWVSSS